MMSYRVQKIPTSFKIDAQWDKAPWMSIEPLSLQHYMGDKPDHRPSVQAKVAYDDQAIYVIFRVEDQYVRAIRTKHQEGVFKDSCVEFFFSPEEHSNKGYFNLEMNCGGTMLFHHQLLPRKENVKISDDDIKKVEVAHSLPSLVDPEIQVPTTWTVEYRIPFKILGKYHDMAPPVAGTIWRSNFYKCADESSHPHWLTWAPIDFPKPSFHIPEFFGTLRFM
ncbi:MAG: carbohydrate-binding family 9-like protein [Bacteroidetes bacterium]|nr:carbohydrate-binding family 9-like protein [Bacteroidota bacterium]MDA1122435.1 carbohydrate-binding family 9-like protein [Bacteroidota bacterium]